MDVVLVMVLPVAVVAVSEAHSAVVGLDAISMLFELRLIVQEAKKIMDL